MVPLLVILGLLLLCGIAFFLGLGNIGLLDKTEAMFVEAARQMLVRGDWITPYWNDATRFDKPPLSYWLMAISMQIGGVNEVAARIPSALLATATVFLVFYTLQKVTFSWAVGGIAAAMMTLNPAWIAWGRVGVSDMYLSATITIALLSFFLAYSQNQWPWYLSFYIFIGLAVLSKGPVGLLLPFLIIACFLLYLGGETARKTLDKMRLGWGLLVIAAVTLPWYIAITLRHGWEYINTFFGYHNFQRFTSVVSNHPGPWYYFVPVLIVGVIPWSGYLPLAIFHLKPWKRHYWLRQPLLSHLGVYAFFWLAIIFTFFSVSATKLPSYILPAMPAAIILVALLWGEIINDYVPTRQFVASSVLYLLLLLIVAIANGLTPSLLGGNPLTPGITEALESSGLATVGVCIWGMGVIGGVILLLKPQWRKWLWIVGVSCFACFILFFALPAASIIDTHLQLPLRRLAQEIITLGQPEEKLIMIGFIRPSLVFYTQKPVLFFDAPEDAIQYIRQTSLPQYLVVADSDNMTKFLSLLPEDSSQPLAREGVYQLIRGFSLNKT
ncbi:MAG: glycosyltransferase family 39 protein [Geminocystis sp.]|nr:glycosyltransferase family 39 protein [Geminocystis sp.]HIK38495.1 glycosyltransferase family 39 protein [Geminocystis sp. M7585_C2015_104]MCS7147552.1 glycosyltransferase family 39 protein [Geminocystis sp.]MCX8077955.1 glycosyltransferase family 39 protein [Geminocystis sp.]MDW8115245.1 glycosyltransferase family 39 protein [Geminocystis sp.]